MATLLLGPGLLASLLDSAAAMLDDAAATLRVRPLLLGLSVAGLLVGFLLGNCYLLCVLCASEPPTRAPRRRSAQRLLQQPHHRGSDSGGWCQGGPASARRGRAQGRWGHAHACSELEAESMMSHYEREPPHHGAGDGAALKRASLPAGWVKVLDDDGHPYYWHQLSNVTQWDRPRTLEAAATLALAPAADPFRFECHASSDASATMRADERMDEALGVGDRDEEMLRSLEMGPSRLSAEARLALALESLPSVEKPVGL